MTVLPLTDPDPGAMTLRARFYLAAVAFRNLTLGICLLLTPWLFSSAAFIPLFNTLPLTAWGCVMALVGIIAVLAVITRSRNVARLAIAGSAVITLVLTAGLWIGVGVVWAEWVGIVGWHEVGYLLGNPPTVLPARLLALAPAPPSPFLPVIMLALTVKDFAVCAQPLRSPLEERRARRIQVV